MIILVMGVAGSGKSTIGKLLAQQLNWIFVDADAFHPPSNLEKMSQGTPLDERDRQPWLLALRTLIDQWISSECNAVLACSALKAVHRQMLRLENEEIHLVYLSGSFELIQTRLRCRQHHFMPAALLQNQFDTLEEPEDAVQIDISNPPADIIKQIRGMLGV
ncbi:MAG: gluconokinase [Leptolyngbyaceae cyanobacterium MO_188.B28]|nr:gluconokinase [Leptolyngbyaceae cyanobacterium MO_188.B28]